MIPLIHLDFEIRKDYISKVLCLNNDQPITVCGGECYLSKKIEAAKEHQKEDSNLPGRLIEIQFFSQELASVELEIILDEASKTSVTPFDDRIAQGVHDQLWKPPQFS